MRIDELNTPVTKYEYSDFASYYEPMQITKEQKEKRTETAHDLFFDFLMLFVLLQQGLETGDLDYLFVLQQFQDMYADTVSKYARTDDYTREYIDSFTRETMDTTWSHLDLSDENSYWLSDDRASILALNESNSINNYEDLMKSVDEGYTHKTWKAEIDSRTRKDHIKMDGKTIEIDRYFEFPDCMMLFPHDEVNGTAKQNANCRCSLKYSKIDKIDDNTVVNLSKKDTLYLKDGVAELNLQYFADKSKHASYRQKQRGFSDEEIQFALNHPLDDPYNYFEVDDLGRESIRYISEKVIVVVNPEDGKHITYMKPDKDLIRRLKNGI